MVMKLSWAVICSGLLAVAHDGFICLIKYAKMVNAMKTLCEVYVMTS